MKARLGSAGALLTALVLYPLAPAGCGGSGGSTFDDGGNPGPAAGNPPGNGSDDVDFGGSTGGGTTGSCKGLQCQQQACPGGGSTTVTGRVLDPSGTVPIYNAVVYVPNAEVEPFAAGVTCDRCGTAPSGQPVVTALSDANGNFVLRDVPVGSNIPLVVQIGRWRRQVRLTQVTACADTKVDPALSRLPRNQAEGDLPRIAITTGGADSLECFLRKLGIDDAEFTPPSGSGRVHLWKGQAGSTFKTATPKAEELWGQASTLKGYDMVILSCEGQEYNDQKPMPAREALRDYLDAGGRVFASHFHYTWFKNGAAPLPSTATWVGNDVDNDQTVSIDTSFAKGDAFAEWMVNVGASTTKGVFPATQLRRNVSSVPAQGAAADVSRRWVYWKSSAAGGCIRIFTYRAHPWRGRPSRTSASAGSSPPP